MEEDGLLSRHALEGRVAVVTGGGTGIGLAIAKRLGSLGATLVFGSRNSQHLEEGSAELGAPATTRWRVRWTCASPTRWTRWSIARSITSGTSTFW